MDAYDYTTMVTMMAPTTHRFLRATNSTSLPLCVPNHSFAVVVGMISGIFTFFVLLMSFLIARKTMMLRETLDQLLQDNATTKTSDDDDGSRSFDGSSRNPVVDVGLVSVSSGSSSESAKKTVKVRLMALDQKGDPSDQGLATEGDSYVELPFVDCTSRDSQSGARLVVVQCDHEVVVSESSFDHIISTKLASDAGNVP